MNIYKEIELEIKAIVEKMVAANALQEGLPLDRIEATPTKDALHGDIATNVAMVLAKPVGKKPQELAEFLLEFINKLEKVASAEVAGPGFINITLKQATWHCLIPTILKQGKHFGDSALGENIKVNVEFVSANPTGPMHVGHGRGAVVGDALARLLAKAGYEVTKEYYINDAGSQVNMLAESAYLRYREALGEDIGAIPEGLYPGDYLKDVGKEMKSHYGVKLRDMPEDKRLNEVKDFALASMMGLIKSDLETMGIHHDVFRSERALTEAGKVDDALRVLEEKGLIYVGVLEPPKGKAPDDWEPREQTLFKASVFGDDIDRAIKKSDGSWTYFAPDVAYHYDKCHRGFDWLIDVFGADHGGYVKRIKAAVSALTDGKVTLDVKLSQMVKFMRAGEPLKMSKRAGTFVTVRDVVDEVGKDAFRFIMLTRKPDAPLEFDFEKVMEQSKDNPVFYVQYAHARAKSVLRHAKADMEALHTASATPNTSTLALLESEEEVGLIRQIAAWPRLVEQAASAGEPHRVAFYLQELAAGFHTLWNKGHDDAALRFLQKKEKELTIARLSLLRALAITVASGLEVLGVEPVEEMR